MDGWGVDLRRQHWNKVVEYVRPQSLGYDGGGIDEGMTVECTNMKHIYEGGLDEC